MKTLSGILFFVLSLYFAGCSTQTGGGASVSFEPSMSENPAQSSSAKSTTGSGGNHEGYTGPDASDGEIAWGPHN